MEKAVLEALGEKKPEELPDLVLNGINSSDISGITESFTQLKKLEIVNCALKSVSGLPSLPSLKTLMLGDNNLKGKEPMEHIVSVCPHIEILSLVGNKFESVDDMTPLEGLKSLTSLDLFNCPLTEFNSYRDKLWSLLPKLNVLDGYDREGKEVVDDYEDEEEEEEEEEEGESGEDEVGLDYLQREIISDDDEDEYNPDATNSPPSDDHEFDEEEEDEDGGAKKEQGESSKRRSVEDIGPSTKKAKLGDDDDLAPLEEDNNNNNVSGGDED